jgi:aarF domain-containing kinase
VKVPSFSDDLAMTLLEEELGRPWHEIYSELSPSPIAAGTCTKYCPRAALTIYD